MGLEWVGEAHFPGEGDSNLAGNGGLAGLPAEAAGLVLALHSAPIYFYKKGRGRYKAAPEQSLRAAQALSRWERRLKVA